jgi:hypothetical protein
LIVDNEKAYKNENTKVRERKKSEKLRKRTIRNRRYENN